MRVCAYGGFRRKIDVSSAILCTGCQLSGRATEVDGMAMEGLAALFINDDERIQLDTRGVCISSTWLGKWLGKRARVSASRLNDAGPSGRTPLFRYWSFDQCLTGGVCRP